MSRAGQRVVEHIDAFRGLQCAEVVGLSLLIPFEEEIDSYVAGERRTADVRPSEVLVWV